MFADLLSSEAPSPARELLSAFIASKNT